MIVTGLRQGETSLTVSSIESPSIKKELKVHVETICREDAYFNYFNPNKIFTIQQDEFDFKVQGGEPKEGQVIINNSELTYDDLVFDCVSGMENIDLTRLNEEKVLKFLTQGKSIDLNLYRKLGNKEIYLDKIRISYSR